MVALYPEAHRDGLVDQSQKVLEPRSLCFGLE